MNTITEADRIEVVVHRAPEVSPPPPWVLDRSPLQSPLPVQYTFSEPRAQATLIQWLLGFLKIK